MATERVHFWIKETGYTGETLAFTVGSWQWAALMLAMGKRVDDKDGFKANSGGPLTPDREPYTLVEERETFGFAEARRRVKAGKRVSRIGWKHTPTLAQNLYGGYIRISKGGMATWALSDDDFDNADWYELKDGLTAILEEQ